MGREKDRQLALEAKVNELRDRNTSYHAYSEDDTFTLDGEPVFSVLDYWRFVYSQLGNQHQVIAEYLVSKALGIDKAENVSSWTGYDLSYRSKRIEVKSTSYVHPWNKKRVSQIRQFSIAPSSNYYWYGRLDVNGDKLARQNELYIFCLNTNQDIENASPLVIDYWEFYVIPTFIINLRCERLNNKHQKTISLSVVKRLAKRPVKWMGLRHAVDAAIDAIDIHIDELDSRWEDLHGQRQREGQTEAETKEPTV